MIFKILGRYYLKKLIIQKLDKTISRKLKYTKNILVNVQSKALIRLNKFGLNSDELIEILKEVFIV